MSKSNKTAADKPTSRGTVFNVRLGLERERTLAEFIASQDVSPDKTAVILKAFDEFMEKRGFPKSKERKSENRQ